MGTPSPRPKTKIIRSDIWLEPLCCREAQEYLEGQKNCLGAWDRCFHPGFMCWFLDYVREKRPYAVLCPSDSLLFTRTPWRQILYRDFFTYELKIPPWLVSIILWGVQKNRRYSLWVFWFVTGYFDSHREKNNPGPWWIYTTTDIKTLFGSVRTELSDFD